MKSCVRDFRHVGVLHTGSARGVSRLRTHYQQPTAPSQPTPSASKDAASRVGPLTDVTQAAVPEQPGDGSGPPGPEPSFGLSIPDLARLCERGETSAYSMGVVGGPEELALKLCTSSEGGFSDAGAAEVEARKRAFGANILPQPKPATLLDLIIEALSDFTIRVLLASGILSLGLELALASDPNGWVEGAAILAAVAVCVLVTAVNNYQKERQFRELNDVKEDIKVRVVRGGRPREISCRELVVGDLLMVETGDIMPVDAVLVDGSGVACDESHLTGESDDVKKDRDGNPVLYSGSKVMEGVGRCLVVGVGENSQVGILSRMLQGGGRSLSSLSDSAAASAAGEDENGPGALRKQTVLGEKLDCLAGDIGKFGFTAAAISLVAMASQFTVDTFLFEGKHWEWSYLSDYLSFLITSITILVVAVPEGLPLAVTLALAFSVKQMLKENNLVRHLDACETMGCATTICSDKTGTLTQNKMSVVRCWTGGRLYGSGPFTTAHAALASVLGSAMDSMDMDGQEGFAKISAAAMAARTSPAASRPEPESKIWGQGIPRGIRGLIAEGFVANSTAARVVDPATGAHRFQGNRTEVALLKWVESLGFSYDEVKRSFEVVKVFPFSSERKRMTVVTRPGEEGRHSPDGTASPHKLQSFTKGALEIVLPRCTHRLDPSGAAVPITDSEREGLASACQGEDLRVLALAQRLLPISADYDHEVEASLSLESLGEDVISSGLTLVGLVGLRDPLREEVPEAILKCQRAGIVVRMLTGDNHVTAASIAAQCGILPSLEDLRGVERDSDAYFSGSSMDATWEDDPKGDEQLGNRWGLKVTWHDRIRSSLSSLSLDLSRSSLDDTSPEALAATKQEPFHTTTAGENGTNGTGNSKPAPASDLAAALSAAASPEYGTLVRAIDEYRARGMLMEGPEFRRRVLRPDGTIDQAAFAEVWPNLRVMARCSPADKFVLVSGMKAAAGLIPDSPLAATGLSRNARYPRQVIAVTGDGTNDAPALSTADVGFAMNSGTSVAKEASDIILMDDNFNSIVSAVRWGRNVYESIIKFLQFQLVVNAVAIATACGGALLLKESPLAAVQMLWVNLIMDSLASLALATERPTEALLDRPPRDADEPLLQVPVIKHMVGQTLYQLAVMWVLVAQPGGLLSDMAPPGDYTLAFNAFVQMQLFNQINCRKIHNEPDVFEGILENNLFVGILAGEFIMQAIIIEYGGEWFNTHPLGPQQWAISMALGAGTLAVRAALQRVKIPKSWGSAALTWQAKRVGGSGPPGLP